MVAWEGMVVPHRYRGAANLSWALGEEDSEKVQRTSPCNCCDCRPSQKVLYGYRILGECSTPYEFDFEFHRERALLERVIFDLKPCFLLLGAFPEDDDIYEWDVAKLWIAEGCIHAFQYTRSEVIAEYYLWDLISIDAFRYNGKIVCFRVHDLLCLKIAKEEEFLHVFDTPRPINRERRVAVSGKVPHAKTFDAPIRCCLIYKGGWPSYDLKLLRTLNKVVASSTSDFESIFEHLNLRYLTVDLYYKYPRTVYLPSSISLLWNLQILRIRVPDQSSVVAPYEIWEMLQLRYLEIDPICLVDPLPVDGSDSDQVDDLVLRNLDTLWRLENLRLSEEVCRRIPNVRELQLSYRGEASSCYCPHNLGHFHHLELQVA